MFEITRVESVEQIDALLQTSHQKPVWIFKHSLVCPISANAWREYQRFAEDRQGSGDGAVFTVVEIQNARPISDAVAERMGVRHESPQALLVRDGAVIWHASHGSIDGRSLTRALES